MLMQPLRFAFILLALLAFVRPAAADDPKSKPIGAKPAKPTVSMLVGGAKDDLKVLRDVLAKLPGIKFKGDDIKYADFGRDGGTFINFFSIEIADLGKTDIGAIAKAVSKAETSKKADCPPTLFVIIRYLPDSTNNKELREALAKVKGVDPEKSWAGDHNLWVNVDGSGTGKLTEITRALHGAAIKIKDPILDIKD